LPNVSDVGLTLISWTAQEPLTLTGLQLTDPQALLVEKVRVPLCDPDELQLIFTVTVKTPPATVIGKLGLTIVNAALLDVIALMVTGPPVLVTVKLWLALEPTHTLPKFRVVGLTVQVDDCTQEPLTLTAGQPAAGLVEKVRVPLCDPGELQLILTVTVALPPEATVIGSGLITVNAGLLDVTPVIENDGLPLLLTVRFWFLVVPTQTLPKFKGFGEMLHIGATAVVAGLGTKALRSGLAPAKTKAATVRIINCFMASSLPFPNI
jgi:hypothetical protein